MQRCRFLRNDSRMLQQLQRLDQLVAFEPMLPAKTVGIRPLLNFLALKGSRADSAPRNHFALVNPRANTRRKPRVALAKLHACFRQRDAFHFAHFAVGRKQQRKLSSQRNFEGIFPERTLPAIDVGFFRRQHDVAAIRECRCLRDGDGLRRTSRYAVARQPVGRRKSPSAVGQHANANANRFAMCQRTDLAILRGQVALPQMHRAHVAIGRAAQFCCIQRVGAQIPHKHHSNGIGVPVEKLRATARANAPKKIARLQTKPWPRNGRSFRSLPATMPDSAPAPASAYPACAPWIRASAAQSLCRGAREPRKPAVSASSQSTADTREKAPDLRSSCPSLRQDALPLSRDSRAAPPRSDTSCAHPATGIHPQAGALGAYSWTVFRGQEYQSPR